MFCTRVASVCLVCFLLCKEEGSSPAFSQLHYISHSNVNSHWSDLSGLSVNVGESMITQSSKVRDLGVIFEQFLNFDDHITAICRSTFSY